MSMLCASNLYTNLMQARVIPGDETSIGKMSPPDWTVSLGYIFLIYVRYMSVQIMVRNKKNWASGNEGYKKAGQTGHDRTRQVSKPYFPIGSVSVSVSGWLPYDTSVMDYYLEK